MNAVFARIKPEHHLAKGKTIPSVGKIGKSKRLHRMVGISLKLDRIGRAECRLRQRN
jgi:hypothetical protein